MQEPIPLKLFGTLDVLLPLVQTAITAVLPDFLEKELKDEEVRDMIVAAADDVLLTKNSYIGLVFREETRKRIIRKILEIMVDDILLGED